MPDEQVKKVKANKWEPYGLPGPGPGETMGIYGPLTDGTKPKFFKLKAQLLDDGRSIIPLAETENMWAWMKVFASGGENIIHAHTNEDHMFIILAGRAIFYGPNGEEKEVGCNDGLMLPAGTLYRFHASSDEPLVIVRIGCRGGDGSLEERMYEDGKPVMSGTRDIKFKPPVYRKDEFYE